MEPTKNLCAQIPESFTPECGMNRNTWTDLGAYITQILTEHFEQKEKGGKAMSENTRTLAFQVSEDLFGRLKAYLAPTTSPSGSSSSASLRRRWRSGSGKVQRRKMPRRRRRSSWTLRPIRITRKPNNPTHHRPHSGPIFFGKETDPCGIHLPGKSEGRPTLWLWQLRDLTIGGALAVLGAVLLMQFGVYLVAALAALYLFLTIRFEDACILDFIRKAAVYFLAEAPAYRWVSPFEPEVKRHQKPVRKPEKQAAGQ